MRRREVVYGLGASALLLGQDAKAAATPTPAPDSDLSATVIINGKSLDYVAHAGKDLGDFQGQNFVQRCIRVARPDTALTVYFRPDRNSDRVEVVFELGRIWGAANRAAAHLGAYRAVIKRGNTTLATIDVPQHWWFSRWRWQSAPRPVIATGEQLIAAKFLPPYSAKVAEASDKIDAGAIQYRGPMDNAGIVQAIGTTGERPDIGPVTEYQALYLLTGYNAARDAVLAQAEAAGSMPMHVRDENTGGPINFFKYPMANWYYIPQGDPWIKGNETIRDSKGQMTCPWILNTSHDPALNYVPYLVTGDPYFLEELQFQATQLLGFTCYHRGAYKLQVVYPGETRSFAWSLRTIFQLARVTPNATPAWLLPRAYWKHILDDNRTYFTRAFVNAKSPSSTVFHSATRLDSIEVWEEEFVAFVLGWGVLMGFDEWRQAFLWKLQSTLARTNGKSGWQRQWCTPYEMKIGTNVPVSVDATTVPANLFFKDWATAWEVFKARPESHVPETFSDDVSWQQDNGSDYLIYTRGVLALASHLGVSDAAEPFQFVDNMAKLKNAMTRRWAVGA